MSKVEELIKEKCPDGVEFKKIIEIAQVSIGEFVHKNNQSDDAPYPVYNGGTSNTGFYEKYNRTENKIIISARGANAGFVNRVFTKYWSGNSCYTIDVQDNKVNWAYVYFYLKNNEQQLVGVQQNGGIPAISKKQVEEFEIAIPPIEVQQEIVHILDKFTELETELQAELDARKKQYEYCRDMLFTFESNVECKNILDVISMKARVGWQALTKKEYLQEGEYYLITGTDFVEDGSIEFDGCVFVSEERYDMDENIKVHANDILMTKDGTLGKVAFLEKEPPKPATLNGGVYRLTVIKDEVLPRYMYHYFTSHEFKCFIKKVQTGGTIKHLTQKWFETLEIPIPSIEVQKKIIESLDSFNDLCCKKNVGLVAEIEARHKQYEYYRDKLLTFERKVV